MHSGELQKLKMKLIRQIQNRCSYLSDCNFLIRMLYADSYCRQVRQVRQVWFIPIADERGVCR